MIFADQVGGFVWNTKFVRLPIFNEATNCTNGEVCGLLEHSAKDVLLLSLPGVAACNIDCEVFKHI